MNTPLQVRKAFMVRHVEIVIGMPDMPHVKNYNAMMYWAYSFR